MNQFIPFVVYGNIRKLIDYRNINTKYKFLDQGDFVKEIALYEYILIGGTNERTKRPIYIVLFMPGALTLKKSGDFKSFIKKNFATKMLNSGIDMLFISAELPAANVKKLIDGMNSEFTDIYIEAYTYDKFVIVVPEHISVPKHKFATAEEIDQLLTVLYKDKKYFPKILASDSMAIWMGAKTGDVIKIIRPSENVGKSVAYRIVVS